VGRSSVIESTANHQSISKSIDHQQISQPDKALRACRMSEASPWAEYSGLLRMGLGISRIDSPARGKGEKANILMAEHDSLIVGHGTVHINFLPSR